MVTGGGELFMWWSTESGVGEEVLRDVAATA